MPESLVLVLPTPPSSNHFWKARAIYDRNTHKWRGTIYKTKEAKENCDQVQIAGLTKGIMPYPKGVLVVFHLIWFRENMRGDLANREKCVEDALQGVLYANDRQIKAKHTTWELDKEDPRVEVWVTPYENDE